MGGEVRRVQEAVSPAGRRDRAHPPPGAARGLGRRDQALPRRRQGDGQPQTRRARCSTRSPSGSPGFWAVGRPGPLDQDARSTRPTASPPAATGAATSTSASASTPWPPISNGLTLSGLRAYGSTFFVFSDYLRPSMRLARLDGAAGALYLHARFDRRRRGRPDAPAGRAPGGPAGDPRAGGDAAGRRQRGGRSLSGRCCR